MSYAASDAAPFDLARARTAPLAWLYLVLAIPLVVLFAVVMAPVQVADEYSHTARADQISRGVMLQRLGGYIDGGIDAFGEIFEPLYFHPERKVTEAMATAAGAIRFDLPDVDENFQNTAQYGPALYLPNASGIAIGRALDLSVAHTLLLTRCLNGIVAALIAFSALLLLRHGRALAFTTLLLPMSLSAFGSASQDAPILALSLLAVALVSRGIAERRPASLAEFAFFLAIVVLTTMGRPSQVALFALLPAMFVWRETRLLPRILLVVAALAAVVAWILTLRRWLMPPTPIEWNVGDQFRLILSEPLTLPTALYQTVLKDGAELWVSLIGRFGWYDAPMPSWIGIAGALALICALFAPVNMPRYARAAPWALATVVGGVLAISAALYMSWTPVGHPTIGGMQGRYFLTLLPLLAWLVPAYGPRLRTALQPLWLVVFAFPVIAVPTAIWTIMDRYYGSWDNMRIALTRLLLP